MEMTKFQKGLAVVIGICVLVVILAQTYKAGQRAGWNAGHREERFRCEAVIADRVEKGIKGFRRVQGLREASEYEKGREACHD